MTEATKPKRPRGRPRIHANDTERKRAYADRQRVAKRGAAIVENTPDSSNDHPLTVRAQVIEEPAPAIDIPTPAHSDAGAVPEAGSEGPSAPTSASGTVTPNEESAPPALDPKVMTSLVKGAFALVALRGGEHWKVTDEEVEPIAEPMCRQAMRIPVVAALGQDTADLILIGSTLAALVFMRAEQSIALRKDQEQRRIAAGARIVPIHRDRPGETYVVEEASAGDRIQEVREPGQPGVNLGPFRASG